MAGQNVTIIQLTTVTAFGAGYGMPVMAATGSIAEVAYATQVASYMGTAIGVISGTGAPTSTSVTHPTMYMRTDGTATNNRAYITTSTGGWVAFLTAL